MLFRLRPHRDAIKQHSARPADAVLAAGMRTGHAQYIAQAIEQTGARLHFCRELQSIDVEVNAHDDPARLDRRL